MIGIKANFNAQGSVAFLQRLQRELPVALANSAAIIKTEMQAEIVSLGAVDTGALRESVYETSPAGSDYSQAVADASDAYQFNPTAYPSIRAANGGLLQVEPEVQVGRDEAFVGPAASHGPDVEIGFTSIGGNQIPPRPFVANTGAKVVPAVTHEFQEAFRRAV